MIYSQPVQQDLQQLLLSLDTKYALLEDLLDKIAYALPEVQYLDSEGSLRLYTSLCNNLSAQLGQYMRLRRLVLLPYLKDLLDKEEDGHDCRACGNNCKVQHVAQVANIREAHSELRELLEHLQPVALGLPAGAHEQSPYYRSLRSDMMQKEETLSEVLFIEESALIPMMLELQRNIGAHE
jgi:hypothetical protein